jgi:hypothetical protein
MAWSEQQRADLVERFWAGESIRCPTCQTGLRTNCEQPGGGEYILHVVCPQNCDRFNGTTADDPRRAEFRDWNPDERRKIVDDHFGGRVAVCPVDGVPLLFSESRAMIGQKSVNLWCPRCHHRFTEPLPGRH